MPRRNHVISYHRATATLVVVLLFSACLFWTADGSGEGCTVVTQRVQCRSLTCNDTSGDCMLCTDSAQCYQQAYGCNDDGHCVLKALVDTFSFRTLLAPFAGFVVCAIAVLAGVGGGAILSPMFNVILEIPFSDAVALAQCAICGQSLLNVALQMMRTHREHTHPLPTRPNINYEYCALLLPIALSGTFLGAMGNKVSPNWLRVVLLIVLFSNALYRLIQRMMKEKHASKVAAAVSKQEQEASQCTDDGACQKAVTLTSTDVAEMEITQSGSGEDDSSHRSLKPHSLVRRHPLMFMWGTLVVGLLSFLVQGSLRILLLAASFILGVTQYADYVRRQHRAVPGIVEEKPQVPTSWLLFCGGIIVVFTSISFVTRNAIDCGGALYYSMVVIVPLIGIAMTFSVRAHLQKLHVLVEAGSLPAAVVPFDWSSKTTIVFPLLCIVAGFAATMLGIGGGLVLSSLLLEAGLPPAHASATSGLATLLIASQSVITLIIGEKLRMDYGLLCFTAGIVSTIFGRFVLLREIERRDASYLIVAALAFIMGGSMVAIISYGVWNTYKIFEHDGSLGFGPMCPSIPALTTTTMSS